MKRFLLLMCFGIYLSLCSCQTPRNVIKTTSVAVPNYTEATMIKLIRNVLQNQGYEIKNTGDDFLTTEYYQYYIINNSNPPFDFYIQYRFTLTSENGKVRVTIVPRIKQVNRLNAGAFTEGEVYVFKFDEYERERNPDRITGLGRGATAYCWGQEYFIDFLNEFATKIGIDKRNFDYKLTPLREIF